MLNKILYLKLCWVRASSHLSIPLSIISNTMLFAVFLKVFNIMSIWALLGMITIMVFGFLIIGHVDLKMRIFDREQSLTNKYNPELIKILSKEVKK